MPASKIQQFLRDHHLSQDDHIIVATSGGVDSQCLLFALASIQQPITAVYVDHQIRTDTASDLAAIQEICKQYGIPLESHTAQIRETAAEEGLSLEEAGRLERYKILEECRLRLGARVIATAHHSDDHYETLMHNIWRGCGLSGLRGIHAYDASRYLIRPLLDAAKQELYQYARDNSIPYYEDSTNQDVLFTRNKLRNLIIPEIKELYPRSKEHVIALADELSGFYHYIISELQKHPWYQDVRISSVIPGQAFHDLPPIIQRHLIHLLLTRHTPTKGMKRRIIENIRNNMLMHKKVEVQRNTYIVYSKEHAIFHVIQSPNP